MLDKLSRESFTADGSELNKAIESVMGSGKFHRIDPNEFVGKRDRSGKELFTADEVKQDLAKVESKVRSIHDRGFDSGNIKADFIEAAITTAMSEAGWLGDDIEVINPALFDDLFRGVDVILSLKKNREENDLRCVGLAVDLTSSREEAKDKMNKLMMSLAVYGVPSVKYFKASLNNGGEQKDIYLKNFKIPKVIVSCGDRVMNEASETILHWLQNEHDQGALEQVRNCDLRYVVIQEIYLQLRLIYEVFSRAGVSDVANLYNSSLQTFIQLVNESDIGLEDVAERAGGDGVLNKILSDVDLDGYAKQIKLVKSNPDLFRG